MFTISYFNNQGLSEKTIPRIGTSGPINTLYLFLVNAMYDKMIENIKKPAQRLLKNGLFYLFWFFC